MAGEREPAKGAGLSREAFEQEVAEEITKDLKAKPGTPKEPPTNEEGSKESGR